MSQKQIPNKQSRLKGKINFSKKECDDCPDTDKQLSIQYKKVEQRQKKNDLLRSELIQISSQLDITLDRNKFKKNTEKITEQNQEKKIEILQKELKNCTAQLKNYKKTYDKLQTKIGGGYDVDKISGMLRVVKNREYELYELKTENKSLTSLKRESDRVLNKSNNDRILNTLRDEIMMTKTLINEAKKKERINEKNFKKQEEYITKLELKHRELCEDMGADYEVVRPKREELFPITEGKQESKLDRSVLSQRSKQSNSKNHTRSQSQNSNSRFKKPRQKLYETIDEQDDLLNDDELEEQDKITQEKFEKFDKQKQIIEKNIKVNQDQQKKIVTQKEQQIIQIKKQSIQVDTEIIEKQKELDILKERIQQMQNQLQEHPEQSLANISTYCAKVKDKQVMKKGKAYRKLQGGVKKPSDVSHTFIDAKHLPELKDYKIKQVYVTYGDEYILSMEVDYFLRDGSIKNVTCFKNSVQVKNQQTVSLVLKGVEYIQQINGISNDQHIEYLKIVSTRGNYLMAGNDKLETKDSYKFNLNINKDELPISFFGKVDNLPQIKKNRNRSSEYCLVSIGVECRKKDLYIAASNVLTEKLNKQKQLKLEKKQREEELKQQQQQQSQQEEQQEAQFEEDLGENNDDENDKVIKKK